MFHWFARLQLAELAPRERHRDAQPGPRARGERRGRSSRRGRCAGSRRRSGRRGSARRSSRRKGLRKRAREVHHDGLREILHLVVAELRRERHHDVQPLAAARLEEALEAEHVEHLLVSAVASTSCSHVMPSPGSRSKIMRSGLSMALRGGVPGVELDHVHLRRADQRLRGRDLEHRRMPGPEARIELPDAGDLQLVGVLLEEELALDAGGRAHQRDRPAREVRQHVIGDAVVVAHEVELGRLARAIDDALGVADLEPVDGLVALVRRG